LSGVFVCLGVLFVWVFGLSGFWGLSGFFVCLGFWFVWGFCLSGCFVCLFFFVSSHFSECPVCP